MVREKTRTIRKLSEPITIRLKSQVYNPGEKFKTFTDLKANDGRANSLHYKTGFVIGNFIEKLNKEIPVLKTSL